MELAGANGEARNIPVTEVTFGDHDMSAWQTMADVYLPLHRAEGDGLNIREMLEIGTPTIATGWSGNMEFMPLYPHAVTVPFELVPYVDPTHRFLDEGIRWAEPDAPRASAERAVATRCVGKGYHTPHNRSASPSFAFLHLVIDQLAQNTVMHLRLS